MLETEAPLNLALPGNQRYQPKEMVPIFGYDYLFKPVAEVEIATLQVLGDISMIPSEEMAQLTTEVTGKLYAIRTTQVDRMEREVTKHDVRAWIMIAQEIIGRPLSRWLHIPLTTYDALATARTLQFIRAYDQAIEPSAQELVGIMAALVRKFASQLQIGRTHGQHALPITVGFWLATVLSRILDNLEKMEQFRHEMVGKISGAVGAYNGQEGLLIQARCGSVKFEDRVLGKLGLSPAQISTQIAPPEPVAYFLFSCCMLSAALGQLGCDCRQLMRSEIGEIAEEFEEGQAGSSTMGHKRNPITFENVQAMWLRSKNEFGKVMDTMISEHQRDLVGSAVARDFPIILINLQQQLNTMLRRNKKGVPFLRRVTVNAEACERNFEMNAHVILAEPLYCALQMAGYEGDAHKLVNHTLVPMAQQSGKMLISVAEEYARRDEDGFELANALVGIPPEVLQLLYRPENYLGEAAEKALEVADLAEEKL